MSSGAWDAAPARYVVEAVVALAVVGAMDLWAALLHGRVWHGVLWSTHRSHHEPRSGLFERNDFLSGVHAPLAIALILYGCKSRLGWAPAVAFAGGVGMTLFGLVYVVIHDGLVHKRFPVRFLIHVPGMRAIVRAHRVHHASKVPAPPFGLLLGPLELRRARLTCKDALRERPSAPQPTDRARA